MRYGVGVVVCVLSDGLPDAARCQPPLGSQPLGGASLLGGDLTWAVAWIHCRFILGLATMLAWLA